MKFPLKWLRSAACAMACVATAFTYAHGDSRDFEIRTLSSRANTVSGGDVWSRCACPGT